MNQPFFIFYSMKIKIKSDVSVQCCKCFKKFVIPSTSFKYEKEIVDKRSMGPEFLHTLSYNGKCEQCKNYFYINVDAYEYPENCQNYTTNEATGVICETPELVCEEENVQK